MLVLPPMLKPTGLVGLLFMSLRAKLTVLTSLLETVASHGMVASVTMRLRPAAGSAKTVMVCVAVL